MKKLELKLETQKGEKITREQLKHIIGGNAGDPYYSGPCNNLNGMGYCSLPSQTCVYFAYEWKCQ